MYRFTICSITYAGNDPPGIAMPVSTLSAKKALRIYAKEEGIKLLALIEQNGKYSAVACGLRICVVGTQRIKIKTPMLLSAHYLMPAPNKRT